MKSESPATAEARVVAALRRLEKNWPAELWLMSDSGSLRLMRYGPDGDRVFLGDNPEQQRLDPESIVETFSGIPNDGGDPW